MSADLFTFSVPDPEEIRDGFLRTIKAGLIQRGVLNPNVSAQSDFYVEATAFSNEASVVHGNTVVKADEIFPDTAPAGDALIRAGARVGVEPRNPAGSFGSVVLNCTASTTIALGQQLIDPSGLIYEVTVGGLYNNGDQVPIQADAAGASTNLPEGTSLRWQTAPPFSASAALVGLGGLINGTDVENPEAFRARVLSNYQNPPGNGNPQHVINIAEQSSPSVQKAFVYPTIQGPSTDHVAVCAAPTATNPSREISSTLMAGTIVPYIQGALPTRIFTTITTVTDVFVTCAFAVALPSAPTGSPPGPGGGWLDGTPFPQINPTAAIYSVPTTAVLASNRFTIAAPVVAPTVNVSRIAYFSFTQQRLYKATVIAYDTLTHEITIDTPFVGINAGDLIFPQSANQELYIAAIKAGFELMGPGEKSTNTSVLVRGFRHPPPVTSWPSGMGPNLLRAITDAGEEVGAAQYAFRYDGITTNTSSGGTFYPAVPVVVTDPPNLFVPFRIGIYPISS